MLKYEHGKMIRCLFLEGNWTCDDCDMRKAGICTEKFYKKHGYFRGEIDGTD